MCQPAALSTPQDNNDYNNNNDYHNKGNVTNLLFAPDHKISFHGVSVLSIRVVFRLYLVDPEQKGINYRNIIFTFFNKDKISKSWLLLESESLGVKIESCPIALPHM